jgi:hypothetical protein
MTAIFRNNLWSPNHLSKRKWIISRRLNGPERKAYLLFSSRTALEMRGAIPPIEVLSRGEAPYWDINLSAIPVTLIIIHYRLLRYHRKSCNNKCRLRVQYPRQDTKFYERINNNVLRVGCSTYTKKLTLPTVRNIYRIFLNLIRTLFTVSEG